MGTKLHSDIFFTQLSRTLTDKQKQIEEQMKNIEAEDSILLESLPEVSELGEDAWKAEAHSKAVAVSSSLQGLSLLIKKSLHKISLGTYGLCDKCGYSIELERLQAAPAAALCITCATIASKL